MFVVLSYDVNKRRVGKVCKTCRIYLHSVQKSVFEGNITEAKLAELKSRLARITDPREDGIRIYKLASVKFADLDCIGRVTEPENIL